MSTEILAFISPIASALIIWYVQYHNIKRDKQRDLEREQERKRQERKKTNTCQLQLFYDTIVV